MTKEIPEPKPLTPVEKERGTIFKLSYFYSQGNPVLQKYLCRWLDDHGYYKRDENWEEAPDYINAIGIPKYHISFTESSHESFGREWRMINGDKPVASKIPIEDEILYGMISRDSDYQTLKERPNRPAPHKPLVADSMADSRASFVRRYILNGHSSGHVGFDALFALLKEKMENIDTLPSFGDKQRRNLELLMTGWEKHHRGNHFFPNPQIRKALESTTRFGL